MKTTVMKLVRSYAKHISSGTTTACIAMDAGIEHKEALKILKELETEGRIERIVSPNFKSRGGVSWVPKRRRK